jgi:hypothetical protein
MEILNEMFGNIINDHPVLCFLLIILIITCAITIGITILDIMDGDAE